MPSCSCYLNYLCHIQRIDKVDRGDQNSKTQFSLNEGLSKTILSKDSAFCYVAVSVAHVNA